MESKLVEDCKLLHEAMKTGGSVPPVRALVDSCIASIKAFLALQIARNELLPNREPYYEGLNYLGITQQTLPLLVEAGIPAQLRAISELGEEDGVAFMKCFVCFVQASVITVPLMREMRAMPYLMRNVMIPEGRRHNIAAFGLMRCFDFHEFIDEIVLSPEVPARVIADLDHENKRVQSVAAVFFGRMAKAPSGMAFLITYDVLRHLINVAKRPDVALSFLSDVAQAIGHIFIRSPSSGEVIATDMIRAAENMLHKPEFIKSMNVRSSAIMIVHFMVKDHEDECRVALVRLVRVFASAPIIRGVVDYALCEELFTRMHVVRTALVNNPHTLFAIVKRLALEPLTTTKRAMCYTAYLEIKDEFTARHLTYTNEDYVVQRDAVVESMADPSSTAGERSALLNTYKTLLAEQMFVVHEAAGAA